MTLRPIPQQHETARAAQRAVEDQLAPCITTRLSQGDDYGLDGYVQHVRPGKPPLRTSLLFGLQVKGTEGGLQPLHQERLQTGHLIEWTTLQIPVVVAVHSTLSGATRWRTAAEIVEQLDAGQNHWRTQQSVTVAFPECNEQADVRLHDWIHRSLVRSSDPEGGRTRFHKSFRRTLLTELYHGYAFVGQHAGLSERPGGPAVAHFVTGMQWSKGEVDETAVLASRVLCGALLLFDEVYFPASLTYAAVGALGPACFLRLLSSRRLVPIAHLSADLAFVIGNEGVGDLYPFNTNMSAVLDRELSAVATRYGLSSEFVGTVTQATRDVRLGEKFSRELLTVSKAPYVRDLLGLGMPRPQAHEPQWAAERLLRIGNVVKFYAVAEQLGVDVVEFEPGLARLALARWGSRVHFHRVYQALDQLQAALGAAALPDIGLLAGRIGIDKCVEIADSGQGAAFREWFWIAAASELADTGSLEGEVASRLRLPVGVESPLPKEFLVAMTDGDAREEGLAARPGGEEALARQRGFSARRLVEHLQRHKRVAPARDGQCLCGSDETFGGCCGRILPDAPTG